MTIEYLEDAQSRITEAREALKLFSKETGFDVLNPKDGALSKKPSFTGNKIYDSLMKLSPSLANSYAQVKIDIEDTGRTSWAGTAHEIRQIVSTLLQLLAPDNDIKAQADYKQVPNTSGPTQKQRVDYILRQQNAGSKVQEVAEKVISFEDIIGDIVRGFYSRASDAAHRSKDKKETKRLLAYFEVFAWDLLDLE